MGFRVKPGMTGWIVPGMTGCNKSVILNWFQDLSCKEIPDQVRNDTLDCARNDGLQQKCHPELVSGSLL